VLRGVRRSTRRPGYTLLEVILASVIAVILLGALYVALDIMLNRMDAGRDAVGGNDLARPIVVTRMTADLAGTLGPLPPKSGGSPADQSAAGGGGSGGSGSGGTGTQSAGTQTGGTAATAQQSAGTQATGTTGTTGTTGAAAGTTDPSDPTTSPAATGVDLPFGSGIIGTDKQLVIFAGRAPDALTDPAAAPAPQQLATG